jgi:hypothetical protein
MNPSRTSPGDTAAECRTRVADGVPAAGLLATAQPGRGARASGKSRTVQARRVRDNRLADALQTRAFGALRVSPGARRHYDRQRAREVGCNPALRRLGSRLVGILHGCLKTRTLYDEAAAWSHHAQTQPT